MLEIQVLIISGPRNLATSPFKRAKQIDENQFLPKESCTFLSCWERNSKRDALFSQGASALP